MLFFYHGFPALILLCVVCRTFSSVNVDTNDVCIACEWPANKYCFKTESAASTIISSYSSSYRPVSNTMAAYQSVSDCRRRVCYYTNWSQYRPGAEFFPENIDVTLCTHLVYAFAKLDGNRLAPYEWNDESMYQRFNALKRYTNVKTLLAVGGWSMGTDAFTRMAATDQSRRQFAEHSVAFLKQHGFDGLDLDWEYPAHRGSPAGDREKFTLLVQQLRQTYNTDAAQTGGSPLLLTAAVAAGRDVIDTAYDIPQVSACLDFISLMSYDLHGGWEGVTGHHSALYADPGESGGQRCLNVDWAARYWVQKGCPREKLVIGIPTYARTFKLRCTADRSRGAAACGEGEAGRYTREKGTLAYYEVCELQRTAEVQERIGTQKVPYLVTGDQWVGYEDVDSVREKARYVKANGYGGVMMWALDLDDFTGAFCGQGKYPLWSAVNAEILA